MRTFPASLGFMFACALPLVGLAFVTGPVAGRTGGFGEMTCHECHWDNPINEPSGRLVLSGTPPIYTPGAQYTIIVDLAHPELILGGFQLSARFESGATAGASAGLLRPADDSTQVVTSEAGVSYIQHTKAGSESQAGKARWTAEWVAPASDIPVIFHAAGNAANGDASPLGDFTYTGTASSRAAR